MDDGRQGGAQAAASFLIGEIIKSINTAMERALFIVEASHMRI
jgi:hypothetical protein